MKRQTILGIAFSIFALNAFAATPAQPVVAEGGSDRLVQNRVAEGGADRLLEKRAVADNSDRLFSDAVAAATQTDPLFSDAVAAATQTDPLFSDAVAADGSDRLKGNLVAEGGAERLLERRAV